MTDPRLGKKPGSRRANEATRLALTKKAYFVGERDAQGLPIPNDDAVMLSFVCTKCGTLLGEFGMSTMGGSDKTVFMKKLPDGSLPAEDGRPFGEGKALLECDSCGRNKQFSLESMEAALKAIWKPNSRQKMVRPV